MAKKNYYYKKKNKDTDNEVQEDIKEETPSGNVQEKEKSRGTCNDPAWYASDPQLLRDAAQIPFNWNLGNSFSLHNDYDNKELVVPGICSIVLQPSIGVAENATSPVNVAAQAIYSYVRHANSGSRNYDAPDLMLYLTAMTSVYSYISFLTRSYAVALLYSSTNRYVPKSLFEAVGNGSINYDKISKNLANFRYGINLLINKASAFAVPANMPIYLRSAFLYRDVYIEGTSPKNQMYCFAPKGFYQFREHIKDVDDGAGHLVVNVLPGNMDVDQLIDYGNSLIDPLLNSTNIGLIYGDILKAYGSNTIKLSSIPEVVGFTPQTDIGVLEQIHNATSLYDFGTINTDVHQSSDKSCLVSKPMYTVPLNDKSRITEAMFGTYGEDKVLTTRTEFTDPALVAESSRLMIATKGTPDYNNVDKVYSSPIYCASEIPVATYYHTLAYENGMVTSKRTRSSYYMPVGLTTPWEDLQSSLAMICKSSAFDFRPNMHIFTVTGAAGTSNIENNYNTGLYGAVDNIALVSRDDLRRLHEVVLLSLYNVTPINKL